MRTAEARNTKTLFDAAEVYRGLGVLLDQGQVTELRALEAKGLSDRMPGTISGYFDDAERLVEILGAIRSAKGVYIVLNPVTPSLLARAANRVRIAPRGESTADTHIIRRRWLPIDLDAQRPSGISASDEEHDAAEQRASKVRDYLRSMGWPEPVLADSGNGFHLLFRVSLAPDDNGLVKHCLEALAQRFDDDAVKIDRTVFNPSRIWKLYGSLACKGDDTPDRPHRMARILEAPESMECVSVDLLHALAAEVEGDKPRPQQQRQYTNGHAPKAFDVAAFIARHGFDVDGPHDFHGQQGAGRKWVFRQSPLCEHHDGAAFIIEHASGAWSAGCHHNSCSWTSKELREKLEPRVNGNGNGNGKAHRAHDENEYWPPEHDEPPHDHAERHAGEPKRITYERITCAELDAAQYDLEYLINGVLVARQPMIFAGGKKQLKTNTMVDMAIALATCGYWLGKFKVSRGCRVAVMSGESGLATLQETARRICDAAGKRLADIEALIWSTTLPRFDSPPHLEALREFLKEDEIEVLMIDPAYMSLPGGDAGNLFVQGQMLRNVSEMCQACGVTMILAHHTRKGGNPDPFSPPELEHIAWAGFQEFCRQWVLLSRREKYTPGTGDHKLWLSLGGSAGHSSLWALDVNEGVLTEDSARYWETALRYPDEVRDAATQQQEDAKRAKNDAKLDADKRTLANTMAKYPQGETKNVLKTAAGMSGSRVDLAMAALLDAGMVEIVEINKAGRKTPREGYRLADATAAI